ncbi:hypothetical protein DFJ73DRAFT_803506 [Zopfochytrium polystomum]|nr:hypothetical protein DFJ73DRAFT_803506 [Zopfochytrium polystomum]
MSKSPQGCSESTSILPPTRGNTPSAIVILAVTFVVLQTDFVLRQLTAELSVMDEERQPLLHACDPGVDSTDGVCAAGCAKCRNSSTDEKPPQDGHQQDQLALFRGSSHASQLEAAVLIAAASTLAITIVVTLLICCEIRRITAKFEAFQEIEIGA